MIYENKSPNGRFVISSYKLADKAVVKNTYVYVI